MIMERVVVQSTRIPGLVAGARIRGGSSSPCCLRMRSNKANLFFPGLALTWRRRQNIPAMMKDDSTADFDEEGSRVMMAATEEARRTGQGYLGPEHILLGLLREGTDIAALLGTNLKDVRVKVDKMIGVGIDAADDAPDCYWPERHRAPKARLGEIKNDLRLSDCSLELFGLSFEKAKRLGHDCDSEHLLFGLLGLDTGVAIKVLRILGVDCDHIRTQLSDMLDARMRSNIVSFFFPGLELSTRRGYDPAADFDEEGGRVMLAATEEARRSGRGYLGPPHILLGLLREGTGIAALLGTNFKDVRVEVDKMIGVGSNATYESILLMTRVETCRVARLAHVKNDVRVCIDVLRLIDLSFEKAKELGRDCNSQLLLLGLLGQEDMGVATKALDILGVDRNHIRTQLIGTLRGKVTNEDEQGS